MSELERLEEAESPEHQIEAFAERAAERIGEGAEAAVHLEAVANGIEDVVREHPEEFVAQLEKAAAALVELTNAAGELVDKLGTLLETAGELAKGGAEWVRENPEIVRAACEIVAFVAIAAVRPELIPTLIENAPVERWAAALPAPAA